MLFDRLHSLRYLVALCAPFFSSSGLAATLTVEETRGVPQQVNLGVPVSFASATGEYVSGVQFDLLFDAGVFILGTVEGGEAASEADKDIVFSEVAPGTVRVMVAGMNQNIIPDGVLARARLDVSPDTARGVYPVGVANLSCCDQFGDPLIADGVAGRIIVIDGWPPEGASALSGPRIGGLSLAWVIIAVLYPWISGGSQAPRSIQRARLGKGGQGRV